LRRLSEVFSDLTPSQRLVLHCQVNLGMSSETFCARHGWSTEKFRKVAQRARHKLRLLVDEYHSGQRCRRLEPDLLALAAHAGTDEQLARAHRHVENCPACARYVVAVERASRSAAVAVSFGGAFGFGHRALGAVRKLADLLRHGLTDTSLAGTATMTGGSTISVIAFKAGAVALCVAGALGTYALCAPHARAREPLPVVGLYRHVGRGRTVARLSRYPAAVRPLVALRPLSPIEQINREFGDHRATVAKGADGAAAGSSLAPLSSQAPTIVSQEGSEFGFER
jgi:hypothetical protein